MSASTRQKLLRSQILDRLKSAIDPERMLDVFNSQWSWLLNRGWRVGAICVHRVFPRGDDCFVIKYQLQIDNGEGIEEMFVFGQLQDGDLHALRSRVLEKLRKSRRKQIDRLDAGDVISVISDPGMLLRVPGFDEKLSGLSLLHNPRAADDFMRRFIDIDSMHCKARPQFKVFNHRLGKRCVLGVYYPSVEQHPQVVLRCLRDRGERFRKNQELMQRLWHMGFNDEAEDGIRVPRALGYDELLATEVIEAMPGQVLGESDQLPLARQAMVAGETLGKLHACQLQAGRNYHAHNELEMLEAWVALTGWLCPELEVSLLAAQNHVIESLTTNGDISRPCLAHRDFYGKQLIYSDECITLIDFDTLCQADPALDIGNYLAHRKLSKIAGEAWSANEVEDFLSGYEKYRVVPPRFTINAWYDAALLRLACLYAMHTGWESVSRALLGCIGNKED